MKPNFGGLNYHKVPRLSSLLCMLRSLPFICPNIDIVNTESSNGARIHVGWKVVLSQNDAMNSCTMRKKYVSTLWNINLDFHPFSSLTTLKTGRPGTPKGIKAFPYIIWQDESMAIKHTPDLTALSKRLRVASCQTFSAKLTIALLPSVCYTTKGLTNLSRLETSATSPPKEQGITSVPKKRPAECSDSVC